MTISIAIIDYGMGNLRSVWQALIKVAPEAQIAIVKQAAAIRSADRVVLPGQGAMPDCMRSLRESGLWEAVRDAARIKPILGICIGQQMLFDWSAEGGTEGLGLIAGHVVRFSIENQRQEDGSRFKVPQIGWNRVHQTAAHPLWHGISNDCFFYFVHSYYVVPDQADCIMGETTYGLTFPSAIAHDNIFATQFHPEKSAGMGLQLYRNFVTWQP